MLKTLHIYNIKNPTDKQGYNAIAYVPELAKRIISLQKILM